MERRSGKTTAGALGPMLAEVDLFAGFAPEELEALAASARRRRYAKGETIFLRGDTGTALYVVESGRVRVALTAADGREFILDLLGPGEVFGDLALLDGGPRSADALAHEACVLVLLQREDFLRFLQTHPKAAPKLLAVLSRRLRHNADQLEDINFLDVPARLARLVLQLAETQGERVSGGVRIPAQLTQVELASMVGSTRESVNRWLRFYEQQGFLRYDGGRITVLRPQGLRDRTY